MKDRIVCFCGRDIGYLVAEFLLHEPLEVRFVVNEGEEIDEWYRTPNSLEITRIKVDEIAAFDPVTIIAAFYHKLLPESIYSIPKHGCWNLHLGDSERYRGAYPNIFALINGENNYSVTIHRIDQGIDTGDILAKDSFPIAKTTTGKELYELMTEAGIRLFKKHYSDLLNGEALKKVRTQNSSEAVTHYRNELSHEVFPSKEFINSVRALTFPPYPPPFFKVGSKRFVITEESSS